MILRLVKSSTFQPQNASMRSMDRNAYQVISIYSSALTHPDAYTSQLRNFRDEQDFSQL
ncbi:hypothetical protein EG68_01562 [Paragonimus skrjabini miyazakii]|uniref:Uncharacterized protein n=1 Tax=Paragonimus skrjabini miyazakii TaxID=59628 RepID=A0A8S9ZB67_9TREM|nr:hypothetical protein EG68_01562 [Paragonimus skrjabini miyazakii]